MSAFRQALRDRQTDAAVRSWVFVSYDQLHAGIGPLARMEPEQAGIIAVESTWKAARRPYHRQKLALVLANLRHFCLEQAERGVAVRHVVVDGPYRTALETLTAELGPIRMMRPAERELRRDLQPLVDAGRILVEPHEGWLTTAEQFLASSPKGPPFRMDAFYRVVRKATGILMERGKPIGGKYSFDAENRRPWRGEPPAPTPPTFPADPVKNEVGELIESRFASHPGKVDLDALPATGADAERLWEWAKENCLPWFGPFEDAMSSRSSGLFHTRLSALVNLHRLLPKRLVNEAAALEIDLACKEGFIRQILGWREFVRHVHEATDGFRLLPRSSRRDRTDIARDSRKVCDDSASDEALAVDEPAAAPNFLSAANPLPPAYWGVPSGLECLDRVVADVWRTGYSHHITRLMVLSNIAALLDVSPRDVTDWFWVAYIDAFDWVVEPNVLGMGTYAVGDLMTTKPYICGSAYIDRMSDYCSNCRFDPAANCPLGPMYWAYLARHRERLADNPRLRLPLQALARRSDRQREQDQAVYRRSLSQLQKGLLIDVDP